MIKASLFASLLGLLNSLIGFLNQLLIAKFFGSTIYLDAYFIAISIPLLFTSIVSGFFSFSVVPFLVRTKVENPSKFREISGFLLLIFSIFSVAIGLLACILSPSIIIIIAPKIAYESQLIAINISRLAWITFSLSIIFNYLSSLCNTQGRFIVPIFLGILPTIMTIISNITLSLKFNVYSLAIGLLLGYVIVLPLIYFIIKDEIEIKKIRKELWIYSRSIFSTFPLILMSMLCFTIYGTVDSIFASRLGDGNLSYLGYSQRLVVSLANIIILGPSLVLTPYLTEKHSRGESKEFNVVLGRALRLSCVISTFIALNLSFLRIPFTKLLFQRGAFGQESTNQVSSLLPLMMLGMIPMVGVVLIIKALHSRNSLKFPAFVGILGSLIYYSLCDFLSRKDGLRGIGSAYAITWWIIMLISIPQIWSIREISRVCKSLENRSFYLGLFCSVSGSLLVLGVWDKLLFDRLIGNLISDQFLDLKLFVQIATYFSLSGIVFYGLLVRVFKLKDIVYLSKFNSRLVSIK